MGDNIAGQDVVTRYRVYERTFEVTRTAWTNSSGLSFDITDAETGYALHDESYDDLPDINEAAHLIDQLMVDRNHGILHDRDIAETRAFAEKLVGGGYLKLSLRIANRCADAEVETAADGRFVPAPVQQPEYTVHYRIVAGVAAVEGSSVYEGTETVVATDEEAAGVLVGERVRETNAYFDDRLDPRFEVISVIELAGSDQRLREWAEDHLVPFAGTNRHDQDVRYRIEIRDCSDPALVGKAFDFWEGAPA